MSSRARENLRRGSLTSPAEAYAVYVPYLYGDRITDANGAELLQRLQARGTSESILAAKTIGKGAGRDATAASGLTAREAILLELVEWDDLAGSAPGLVRLRDRLSGPQQGQRII